MICISTSKQDSENTISQVIKKEGLSIKTTKNYFISTAEKCFPVKKTCLYYI